MTQGVIDDNTTSKDTKLVPLQPDALLHTLPDASLAEQLPQLSAAAESPEAAPSSSSSSSDFGADDTILAGLGDAAERSPGPLLEEMANGLDEESGLIRMNGFHGDLVGFDEGGIGMGSPEDGQAGEQGYGDSANERMLEERSPVDLRRVKVRLVLFFFLPFLFPIFYRVVVAS